MSKQISMFNMELHNDNGGRLWLIARTITTAKTLTIVRQAMTLFMLCRRKRLLIRDHKRDLSLHE